MAFKPTSPMSTHQVNLVISDFNHTSHFFLNGNAKYNYVWINVYARSNILNLTIFASEFAKTVMEFYVNYFNHLYDSPRFGIKL